MNSQFWKGKRVFLTGHTGFKGGWLSVWLNKLGAHVTGYSLEAPTIPNLYTTAGISRILDSHMGDIRDLEKLNMVMQQARPEIVINMAAQPLVRYSYQNPIETYSTNVLGTVHVFEAIRKLKTVRAVVNVTTDKCYENKEWFWPYREDEPMGGYDPYSSSKGCAELVTKAYRRSFMAEAGISLARARAGNVIGGGDWAADRLVPDIIRAFSQDQPVIVRNPHAIRPWQHVLEPLSGYLSLAENLYTNGESMTGAYNFGPLESDARPVRWMVEAMVRTWGANARWALDEQTNPHEAKFLRLDCSKALNVLGWSPRWKLETTLEKVTAWYKAHLQQGNMLEFSLAQIADYENSRPLMHDAQEE